MTCFIYSGWLRTWEYCQKNHAEMLPAPDHVVHYNESNQDILFYKSDIWGYNKNKVPENIPVNTMCMWRNMYKAFHQAPKDYDVYVRNRYDICFNEPIHEFKVEPNTVYIPQGQDYRDGINDQFAYGDRNAMEMYFNVYINAAMFFGRGVPFHSETYMKLNLNHYGLRIVRIPQTQSIYNFYNNEYVKR